MDEENPELCNPPGHRVAFTREIRGKRRVFQIEGKDVSDEELQVCSYVGTKFTLEVHRNVPADTVEHLESKPLEVQHKHIGQTRIGLDGVETIDQVVCLSENAI